MIASFRHKRLERLFRDDNRKGLPHEMLPRLRELLAAIDAAVAVEELAFPSYRLHALKGDMTGLWSVTVIANWRIVFRFSNGSAYDLDYLDYH